MLATVLLKDTGSQRVTQGNGQSVRQIGFPCGGECVENQVVGHVVILLGLIESMVVFFLCIIITSFMFLLL